MVFLLQNRYAVLHELKWVSQQECKQSAVTSKTRLKSIQLGPRVEITFAVSPCACYGPCAITRIRLRLQLIKGFPMGADFTAFLNAWAGKQGASKTAVR